MNIKDLNSFLQICKEKSITKAAKTLYISPQGLSKTIKNLEKELGAALFLRNTNGIEITECGYILEKKAKEILAELEGIRTDINHIKESVKGKIRLISSYGVLRYLTPDYIMEFRKENPNIGLSYEEYPDVCIDKKIYEEEGDIGFAIGPVDLKKFDAIPLKTFQLKLLVNKKNSLSGKKAIKYTDLINENLIIESNKFKLHEIFIQRCSEEGIKPNILFETNGFSLCHKLCKENKGVSITVDFINKDMKENNVTVVPFEDKKCIWTIYLIKKREKNYEECIEIFKKFVLKWIRTIEEENFVLN